MKCIFPLIVCFLLFFNANAQESDSLFAKVRAYGSSQHPAILFLQTDKHIYLNNEYLWFSGYLVSQSEDTTVRHELLALFLVSGDTRKPVLQQKFVMRNGWGYGSIHLPDSIPPGDYKLIACTNVAGPDGVPIAVFTQDIHIHAVPQTRFTASMTTGAGQTIIIAVRDHDSSLPVKGAIIETWTGSHEPVKSVSDKNGVCLQRLKMLGYDSTIPAIVRARVKYNGEFLYLEKEIEASAGETPLQLRFFPEGGYLINKLPCRVALESKTAGGEPLSVIAILYKDNVSSDTIRTDAHGLGAFSVIPDIQKNYSIRVLRVPHGVSVSEQPYHLPEILSTGMTIHLPQAITGDTTRFTIYSGGYTQIKMLVHNFQQVFELDSFPAGAGRLNVLLLNDKLPKGIAAITLLDNDNHPLAERIFFAHYDQQAMVAIMPDKKIAGKREKVTLQLQLQANSQTRKGFASVSCAQANRFSNSMHQDIESFTFLQRLLQELPPNPDTRWYQDKDFLEKLLLVRGWRRYTWAAVRKTSSGSFPVSSVGISGTIISNKKNKKGSVTVLGDNETVFELPADDNGRVLFSYNQLYVSQDRQLLISASTTSASGFHVQINDPFVKIGDSMAAHSSYTTVNTARFARYSRDLLQEDFAKQKQLAAVVVVAKRKSDRFSGVSSTNECGDYVCSYNILNCPNHAGALSNTLPVVGRIYVTAGANRVYRGCSPKEQTEGGVQLFDGIKQGKEFYPEDFSKKTSEFPENLSTLYWSPGLYFDNNGNASCSFYTGDLTGTFRIIINGTTGNDVFSATELIEVK